MAPLNSEEQKVVNIATMTGVASMLLAAVAAVIALLLPWWTGTASGSLGRCFWVDAMTAADGSTILNCKFLSDSTKTLDGTITLWSIQQTIQTAAPLGQSQGKTILWSNSWDSACKTTYDMAQATPAACTQLTIVRVFLCLQPIFGLVTVLSLLLAQRLSPLLLLLGALLGIAASMCATVALVLGLMTSSSGLNGYGFDSSLVCIGLSVLTVIASMYAASRAMPRDSGLFSQDAIAGRQAKFEDARVKVMEERERVDAIIREHKAAKLSRVANDDGERSEGSTLGGTAVGPKVPAMLKKVLYWSDDHNPDGDEDNEIPTELLELAFREIDEEGTGSVLLEELVEQLRLCGLNASQAAADIVMKEIDKNCDGNVDIQEFVEFFRTLEDMNRFDKKSQNRARFLTNVCNCCFIVQTVCVSVLLILMIQSGSSSSDSSILLKNLFIACCSFLAFLCVCVIVIPAGRITIGPNMATWKRHFSQAVRSRRRKKGGSKEPSTIAAASNSNAFGNAALRSAAWDSEAGQSGNMPTINGALQGTSYRVSKFTLHQPISEDSEELPGMNTALPAGAAASKDSGSRSQSKGSRGNSKRMASKSSYGSNAGVILNKMGEFERYDPSSFRTAAMHALQSKPPTNFSPMQVHGLGLAPQEEETPAMLALSQGPFYG